MTTSAASRGLLTATVAESHERFRPGYSDEIVDRTLSYAGRPVRTAVEVGAFTGKATRAFASRGVRVTALEADAAMFAVLERETAGMPVEPRACSVQGYDGPPVDLLYAADHGDASRPWQDDDRVADLLVPGGVVALISSLVRSTDPDLPSPTGVALRDQSWSASELVVDAGLVDVERHELVRELLLPQREHVGYLSTLPALLGLDPARRQDELRRVAAGLPDVVRVEVATDLVLARRR
jgi:hypothetical protein